MSKPSEKNTRSSAGSNQGLWYFVLAASLLLNAYFLGNKKDKVNEVLASVSGQTFRWRDVSQKSQKLLQQLDSSYYSTLKFEAELWAEKQVLPKEASARGMSVSDLTKIEVNDKVQKLSPAQVNAIFAQSPSADSKPFPQVLKTIEDENFLRRFTQVKKQYLGQLFTKYGVEFKLKPPAGYQESKQAGSQFPAYDPPPPGDGLNAQKSVVGPPSRGAASAPVVLEVYSDFMCPYSKKFNGTLDALQKKYPDNVRVVYRHFPLPFHQGAEVMAQASACAQEQGKFWEYHDRLMGSAQKLEKADLEKLADELGLEGAVFRGCLASGKYKPWVDRDIASGKAAGVTGTPGFLVNGRSSFGALPVEAVSPLVDWYLKPSGPYPGPKKNPPAQGSNAAGQKPSGPRLDPAKIYDLPKDWLKKGISKGPDSAPVTLVEFLDYNCPFCKKGAEIIDQLVEKNPGKIRVISKNFPLPMHPNAQKTSEALLCANAQGKFWEFRKELFGESWGKFSPEDMKAIAKKTGLKETDFNACLDDSKMKGLIEEDVKVGQSVGVSGTPAFFLNGSPLVGAQPLENFQKAVDQKSNGKK